MSSADRILLRSSPTEDTGPQMGIILGHALSMDCKTVIVARDTMKSSTMMKEALVAGLLSAGVDVIDIGISTGPATAMAASMGDCAVLVTEYRGYNMISGYLLINPDGSLFRQEQIRHLNKVFIDPPKLPESGNLGHILRQPGTIEAYNKKLSSLVSRCDGCSVVLDCGCGTCARSAPQILNSLGVTVLSINAQDDSDFIVDDLDDVGMSTTNVRSLVESNPGYVGISINKIGTMMTILDEKCQPLDPETIFAIIVAYLRPSSVAVPINTSSIIKDAVEGKFGDLIENEDGKQAVEGTVMMTEMNVGAVCREVAAGADLGLYDGGIIFREMSMMPDGIHASAIMASIAGNNSLNRISNSLPRCYRSETSVECECAPDNFVRAMEDTLPDMGGKIFSLKDAWRLDLEEGWFLIVLERSQDPQVRIFAESRDRAYLVGVVEMAENLVRECMKKL